MNFRLEILIFAVALVLGSVGYGVAGAYYHQGDHTCTAPCTIDFNGAQEDEVSFDYRHGGMVFVSRVKP